MATIKQSSAFFMPVRPKKILSSGEVVTRKPEGATLKTKAGDLQRQPLVERPRQMDKSMSTFLQKLRDGSQPAPSRYAEMQILPNNTLQSSPCDHWN